VTAYEKSAITAKYLDVIHGLAVAHLATVREIARDEHFLLAKETVRNCVVEYLTANSEDVSLPPTLGPTQHAQSGIRSLLSEWTPPRIRDPRGVDGIPIAGGPVMPVASVAPMPEVSCCTHEPVLRLARTPVAATTTNPLDCRTHSWR
jgi:hypothetical protein